VGHYRFYFHHADRFCSNVGDRVMERTEAFSFHAYNVQELDDRFLFFTGLRLHVKGKKILPEAKTTSLCLIIIP
jgi:hypothetical protein